MTTKIKLSAPGAALCTLVTALLVTPAVASAATEVTTASVSGIADLYDPSTDYSPATANGGYHPPSQLGGYDAVLTLSGFDTALGVLNSVTVTTTSSLALTINAVENAGSPSSTIDLYGRVAAQTPYGVAGNNVYASFSQSETPGTAFTVASAPITATGSYTNNLPSTFAPFYATQIYVPLLAITNFQLLSGASFYSTSDLDSPYSETVTFTYDYTPAIGGVPEPATWAMLLGGVFGIGALARRRRRGAADRRMRLGPGGFAAALCAVGALLGGEAQATVYTSEASFIAAAGPATIPLPPGPTGGDFTASGFAFTADPGSSFVIDTAVYGKAIPGEDNLLLNSTESFGVAAPSDIHAFGFEIYRPSNPAPIPGDPRGPVSCDYTCGTNPFTVSLYEGATFVDSFTFTPVQDAIEFHGYSGAAFDTIDITEGGTYPENIGDEYFADFRYGVAAVPEPATWLMVIAGFAVVGLAGRRAKSTRDSIRSRV